MKPVTDKFLLIIERNTDPMYLLWTVSVSTTGKDRTEFSGKKLRPLLKLLAEAIAEEYADES